MPPMHLFYLIQKKGFQTDFISSDVLNLDLCLDICHLKSTTDMDIVPRPRKL